ncbi:MAG: cysteine desulfurase DndA [Verrucomicrobiales bacterium]|nr:cysteine desulfurase DndA [Verrucomicrobiales bacterium]
MSDQPTYLDCNATTPMEPQVLERVRFFLEEEFGNEGSRTHSFGARSKQAVQKARDQVAEVVAAKREEVVFTSGATESNNLAILGLEEYGRSNSRMHVIATAIEHKAVLEPIEELEARGFDVTFLPVNVGGWVEPESIEDALRPETLLVSVMQANNETGVRQPLAEISDALKDHDAFFHVDAAQGFGKDIEVLQDQRIDLISVSGHKIYGPKGVGALVTRKRGFRRTPLKPLSFGGGQERGLRPGTLPVALIAGLGEAASLALKHHEKRKSRCEEIRKEAISALSPLSPKVMGDSDRVMEHVLCFAFPGVDSEALMVSLKDLIAISNGSACTSHSYTPSHVLKAMGFDDDQVAEAVRISWCHLTPDVDWKAVRERIKTLM